MLVVRKSGGEEVEVARELQVHEYHDVGEHSHWTDTVLANVDGDTENLPDAVTSDLAEWVFQEFNIDVERRGIEVIDPDSDDVDVV